MQSFDIEFGVPSHGWMEIRLSTADQQLVLHVSDVPCDSIRGLVSVLTLILQGSMREFVEWSLEPEYAEWTLICNGDDLELTVTLTRGSPAAFSFHGSKRMIVRRLLKGLSDLRSNPVWQAPNAIEDVWSWEFPDKQLAALKERLKNSECVRPI